MMIFGIHTEDSEEKEYENTNMYKIKELLLIRVVTVTIINFDTAMIWKIFLVLWLLKLMREIKIFTNVYVISLYVHTISPRSYKVFS